MVISVRSKQAIDTILGNLVQRSDGVPGVYFKAIDEQGQILYEGSKGVASLNDKTSKITADTLLCIASCTKLVTAIAAMQLVEQGRVALDDPSQVTKYLPELEGLDIITESTPDKITTRRTTAKITLRQLLDHSSGAAYGFLEQRIIHWGALNNNASRETADDDQPAWFKQPLVAEPGKEWNYGFSLDLAGAFVERVTGMTLGQYFTKNIFEPLGIQDTYFGGEREHVPTRFAAMHQKSLEGVVAVTDHFALVHTAKFQSGGAGLVSTVDDFMKILGCVMNNGVGHNGCRILKSETVDLMFQGSLTAEVAHHLEKGLVTALPPVSNDMPFYPGTKKNWGLSFLITEEELPTGRGAGAAHWAGLPNLYWIIDRKKGVALFIASQILPFADPVVLEAFHESESAIYKGLEEHATEPAAALQSHV